MFLKVEHAFLLTAITVRPIPFQTKRALRRTWVCLNGALAALKFLPSGQRFATLTKLGVGHHTSTSRRSARIIAA